MYTKFDFEKIERSRVKINKTLGALDVLGTHIVDFTKYCNMLNDDEKMLLEERAAIIEFDGSLPRDQAEFLALDEIIKKLKTSKYL